MLDLPVVMEHDGDSTNDPLIIDLPPRIRSMKQILLAGFVGLSLLLNAHNVQASMIGDLVTIELFTPVATALNGTNSTVVTADDLDAIFFGGASPFPALKVDPFDSGFDVSQINNSQVYASVSYLEFTDLHWLPTPGEVIGVNIVNNSNLSFTSTSYTADSARIEFNGVMFTDQSFTVNLITEHVAPVPEPSSLILMGIGGIALIGYGARRKRQQAA